MGSLRSLRRRKIESVPPPVPSDEEVIEAICFGTTNHLKALLAQGASPNAQDGYSNTAVGCAALEGKLRMAQVLVKHGADVNLTDSDRYTALYLAMLFTSKNAQKICRLLLDHGADVNAANAVGKTPLMAAVRRKEFEIAKLLLERGADASLKNFRGDTALDLLRRAKGYKALRKLLEQAL
jgi:ankyrin repeat protein